jgi:general secretion pathway protein I
VSEARGFTLLEVLIAMAVVAIALAAAVRIGSTASVNAGRLEGKTFAHWVAMNRMEELRAEGGWPGTGTRSGTEEQGDRIWEWTRRVESTADADVRRVEIEVARDDEPDKVLAVLTGYLGRPPARPGLR